MNNKLIGVAVAATLTLTAFNASADEDMYRGAWYALPGISYNWTDSDVKADDGVGPHLRFGKELSEHWDIQVGLTYTDTDEETSLSTKGDYKQTSLGVDALYMFSRSKFRPFVLAGLGVAHNNTDYDNANWGGSKTSPMVNVGAGFQYLFSDKFGLQADVREAWSRAETGLAGNRDTDTIGNTILSFGAIWRFGEPAQQVVAAEPEPMPAPAPMPEPAPAPAPAPVCKHEVEQFTLGTDTLFAFDKYNLTPEGKAALDSQVAEKMKANPIYATVRIEGHTDRLGSDEYNQGLSERRADTVKAYLVSQGVDPERLIAVGMGEDIPLVDCKGVKGTKALIECLAPNRRVDIQATRSMVDGCK